MKQPSDTQRWWDAPSALLLIGAMLTVATRFSVTRWTDNLGIAQTLVLVGAIAGLALGASRFSPGVARLFSAVYGCFFIFLHLGLTIDQDLIWITRLSVLFNRLGVIIYQISSRDPVQDSLLFLVIMFFLFWGLGSHAGYSIARHGNVWSALLPAGLTLFIIHTFDPLVATRNRYLAIYLFFALALIARMTFLGHQNRWQRNRIVLPPNLGLDFIRFTIIASLVIVLFAWTAPALANALPVATRAWQPIRQTWLRTVDQFDNAFASLRATVAIAGNYYGRSAVLGLGSPLTDAQIFTVRAPANFPEGIRLYWRARVYDIYENGQWSSSDNLTRNFDPLNDGLPIPGEQGRWVGSFEFISATPISTLFTPAQPLWVSRNSQLELYASAENVTDIASLRARPLVDAGQAYAAQASLTYAAEEQLRQAGTDYPDWITKRYLQLPGSITLRTRRLAEEITRDQATPYDKAVAITEYLRKNITYVETIQEPIPNNQEVLDWFLFDLKKGFCNYYSSAEIIMLRSLGIPARWAVGYAQGERTVTSVATGGSRGVNAAYLVRARDAHAWPEVYFPGIGWVEFEPTAAQPEITRLVSRPTTRANPANNDFQRDRELLEEELALLGQRDRPGAPPTAAGQLQPSNALYWISMGSLLLLALIIFLLWRNRNRIAIQRAPILIEQAFYRFNLRPPTFVIQWARRAALPPLSRAYLEINLALARIGSPAAANDTPGERVDHLGRLLPASQPPATRLLHEYQVATFGQQEADLEIAQDSAAEIRKLSYQTLMRQWLSRLQKGNLRNSRFKN